MGEIDKDEIFVRGERAALLGVLSHVLAELGVDDPEAGKARWVSERSKAVAALRSACDDFGDNDWPDRLNLVDVIEKHLVRHLDASHPDTK